MFLCAEEAVSLQNHIPSCPTPWKFLDNPEEGCLCTCTQAVVPLLGLETLSGTHQVPEWLFSFRKGHAVFLAIIWSPAQ